MAARELPPYTSGADPTCVSVIFCLMTRCRLLRRSEPRSRWCAEATRSSGGSVESSSPSQHLHGGVTVESKASVVVPPRLDTVDICTHTPEGCEVLGSRRPCLTNTASRLCLSVSVPADWGRSRHRQHTGIAVPTWTRAVRTGVLPHPVRHMLRRMAVYVSLVSADGDNWARLICARVRVVLE